MAWPAAKGAVSSGGGERAELTGDWVVDRKAV
jgi:hypothetical protein